MNHQCGFGIKNTIFIQKKKCGFGIVNFCETKIIWVLTKLYLRKRKAKGKTLKTVYVSGIFLIN